MIEKVSVHYSSGGDLAEKIEEGLREAGKNIKDLSTVDLAATDEFHFRGREATLQLAEKLNLNESALVLDIGSGLGGRSELLRRNTVAAWSESI